MKEAVTRVIDTLTQEDFQWGFPEVVGTVEQVHCSRRRLLRRGQECHVCTINKSAHAKKVWKLIVCTSYMHKLESILENKTYKLLWYFEIQTDHLISARRPDLLMINKKKKKKKKEKKEKRKENRRNSRLWGPGGS